MRILKLLGLMAIVWAAGNPASILAQSSDESRIVRAASPLVNLLNGFTLGRNTYVMPYGALDDWFEPYGALKLNHKSFFSGQDNMQHHFKVEWHNDFSWKMRYVANSISTKNTRLSFLVKQKLDRDTFYYGIGNTTVWNLRQQATYQSIFLGTELRHDISQNVIFGWSPGIWRFSSGLVAGGDFETLDVAQYATSRVSLSDRNAIDFFRGALEKQWSGYIELGLPIQSLAATYVRFNVQGLSQLPLFWSARMRVGGRYEYLKTSNARFTPYNTLPEIGSSSGLRGYSRERFRNYAIAAYYVELSLPFARNIDGFLLADFAQTSANATGFLNEKLHRNFGAGLRVTNVRFPFTLGIARSVEGYLGFLDFTIGSAL